MDEQPSAEPTKPEKGRPRCPQCGAWLEKAPYDLFGFPAYIACKCGFNLPDHHKEN